jgi:hypothetical protein
MFNVLYQFVIYFLTLPRIPSTQPATRRQEAELKIEAVRSSETLLQHLRGLHGVSSRCCLHLSGSCITYSSTLKMEAVPTTVT